MNNDVVPIQCTEKLTCFNDDQILRALLCFIICPQLCLCDCRLSFCNSVPGVQPVLLALSVSINPRTDSLTSISHWNRGVKEYVRFNFNKRNTNETKIVQRFGTVAGYTRFRINHPFQILMYSSSRRNEV